MHNLTLRNLSVEVICLSEQLYNVAQSLSHLALCAEEGNTMADNPAIAAFATAVKQHFAEIQAGINNLDTLIQNFQNSPGTLSVADQAALDEIVAASSTLATAANTVPVPTPPPAG